MSRANIKCIKLYITKWSDKKLKPVEVGVTDGVPVHVYLPRQRPYK